MENNKIKIEKFYFSSPTLKFCNVRIVKKLKNFRICQRAGHTPMHMGMPTAHLTQPTLARPCTWACLYLAWHSWALACLCARACLPRLKTGQFGMPKRMGMPNTSKTLKIAKLKYKSIGNEIKTHVTLRFQHNYINHQITKHTLNSNKHKIQDKNK